ncbi:MAG: hypothetical protein JOZ89_03565 [Gammaproteobacteria bacterium]|nr:hypothetical protein [Gammaproteobacteria bacterium]
MARVTFVAAAMVHRDASQAVQLAVHRAIVVALFLALAAAAVLFARAAASTVELRRWSAGALAAGGLLSGACAATPILLSFRGFPAGAWERVVAALALGSVMLLAASCLRRASTIAA